MRTSSTEDSRPPYSAGKPPFDELDIVDRICIEDREKAKEVGNVVNGYAIDEDEVLVRSSAAHVETRGPFRPTLNARKQLDDFEQIRLSKQDRQVFHRFDVQIDRTHLGALLDFAGTDTHHFHFFQVEYRPERA